MRILTVDVGTGTQDVFLYDSRLDVENGFKLVLPSPTMMVHDQIRAATRRGEAVLLTGRTMGERSFGLGSPRPRAGRADDGGRAFGLGSPRPRAGRAAALRHARRCPHNRR